MIRVVGEALVDLVSGPDDVAPRAHPGGSPANVALGLARLGVPVTLTTQIGYDDLGALVRAHLATDRLTVDEVGIDPRTSTAEARVDADGRASYDFRIGWDPGELSVDAGETECVHTGSLATLVEPGASAVRRLLDAAGRRGVLRSYDPNVRPTLVLDPGRFRRDVESVAAGAEVVKMSREDLDFLCPDASPTEVARTWARAGRTCVVVVTEGAAGATAATRAASVQSGPWPVDVVDTVGAGDAFTAGLLAGLHRRGLLRRHGGPALAALAAAPLAAVVDEATLVASLTCARGGADPPTRAEADSAAQTSRPERR